MSEAEFPLEIHEEGEIVDTEAPRGVDSPVVNPLQEFLKETQPDDEDHCQATDGSELEDDFLSSLADSVVDKQGPAVSGPVAKLFSNHLDRNYAKGGQSDSSSRTVNNLVDKLKAVPVPANLTDLKTCRVNEGVYKAMTPPAKRLNGDLQLVESALCKGLISQASVMDKLVQLKAETPKEFRGKFNDIFSLLADSVEFSTFARFKSNETRRDQILSGLNEDYKFLSSETVAESGLLFGNNLETAMKSVESANRLSKKLVSRAQGQSRAFSAQRGRGRGRSRGRPQPYQTHDRAHFQADKRENRPRRG